MFTKRSSKKFGNVEELLKKKTKKLEELQHPEGHEHREAIKQLGKEIEYILEEEDFRRKQQEKQNWDCNTLFFFMHGLPIERK